MTTLKCEDIVDTVLKLGECRPGECRLGTWRLVCDEILGDTYCALLRGAKETCYFMCTAGGECYVVP